MENLRILVKNINQKNEIIGYLIELGYNKNCWTSYDNDDLMGIHVYKNGDIQDVMDDDYEDENHKEITLPELRDLVVLKRNNVGDATHKGSITDNVYYVSSDEEVYRFESSTWCFSTVIVADLKPIEKKEMKEYLDPENNYRFNVTDKPFFDWIEIPEGAEVYAMDSMLGKKVTKFFKEGFIFLDDLWMRCSFNHADGDILWKRHTLPEELTFVDDEPKTKIGELYVDLKVNVDVDINSSPSKHNHYYIDVSDVEEVDFYEIALRYNVTDPCIQHILKKCLAVGDRGHKDFHTDLKDIHDTAVRALRIHAG